ncbi:MAG: excinuclease ABC subunit UvrA, partial [Gammaproteobacteria bacterium]
MSHDAIRIRGARQNNLKNLDLDIPLGELVVVTGVSGSGKSSLAFDTVYAEGQRRYVETFSPYARQFLDRMDRPAVDRIEGIPPAIAVDQTNPVRTSRSTVGTMTELNDHLKLLFARAAHLHCHSCGREVRSESPDEIVKALLALEGNPRCMVTFDVPIPTDFKADEMRKLLEGQGYTRFHEETESHIRVIQDRLRLSPDNADRLTEAVETALEQGRGHIAVYPLDEDKQPLPPLPFSAELHCAHCDIDFKQPIPNSFSFNSPVGACETCRGFGRVMGIDWSLVIPDESKSIEQGAIKPLETDSYIDDKGTLLRFAHKRGIATDIAWRDLPEEDRQWIFDGDPGKGRTRWYGLNAFFEWLESKSYKMHIRVLLSKYRSYEPCPDCHGARLKDESLDWRVGGKALANDALDPDLRFRSKHIRMPDDVWPGLPGLNIHDIMGLPIDTARAFFDQLKLPAPLDETTDLLLQEVRSRLHYLGEVGLGYLCLDRQSRTLSGGEVQRINLTTALGTSLVNTLFVLDEPSIGLHPRDMDRIVGVLHRLRDAGNSLLVVEHDPQVMTAADRIIDIGPGPGEHGGEIRFNGAADELIQRGETLTAQYLRGEKQVAEDGIGALGAPIGASLGAIQLFGATANNLKNIDVEIPLNRLVCVTGVSGSGKSTLIRDVLYNALMKAKGSPKEAPGEHRAIEGHELIDDVVLLDQSPIGRTSRANPASYVGALDPIRKLFAKLPESTERKYTAGTFSFNSGNGRCQSCGGTGFEHVEMQFLSDVYLRCHDCNGKRYRAPVLDIKWNGKSIADVLDLTVTEAVKFFKDHQDVRRVLDPLEAVGLGYVRLGQPVPTLSGGEAQRLKIAGQLVRKKRGDGRKLYILDEPTTGLHFDDIATLLRAFKRLLRGGHSLLVIEHNLDVIGAADWIIDLGPEGGDGGGEIIAEDRPKDIAELEHSHTGQALKRYWQEQESIAESAATYQTSYPPLPRGEGPGVRARAAGEFPKVEHASSVTSGLRPPLTPNPSPRGR